MGESKLYAVYLNTQAIETLGMAVKPYLTDGPSGAHIMCADVDTGGVMCEMTLQTKSAEGKLIELELIIPNSMIKLIVSVPGNEGGFGFR